MDRIERNMIPILLIFFTSFSLNSWGLKTENDAIKKLREEPYISPKYRRGTYLIYDCRKRHYICVNIDGFEKCRKERDRSYERRRSSLRCAPLKNYKTQNLCFQSSYKQIHGNKDKSFCFNKKLLSF